MTGLPKSAPRPEVDSSAPRRNRLWLVVLCLALAVQLLALYSPEVPGGPQIAGLDKVVHISIFAVPALAALMAGISAPLALGVLAVHAPVSELIQHFALSHRAGDVVDMMADLAGVVIGGLVYLVWRRRQP
jgi:hypothetical protein